MYDMVIESIASEPMTLTEIEFIDIIKRKVMLHEDQEK